MRARPACRPHAPDPRQAARRAAAWLGLAAAVGCGAGQARQFAITPERPGISVLAPAQAFPVEPAQAVRGFEVPAGALDGIATAGGPVLDRESRGELPPPPGPSYDWGYAQAGRTPGAGGGAALVGSLGSSRSAWLGPVAGRTGLSRGAANWAYRQAAGPTWAVGSVTPAAPAWGAAPRLAGLQVSDGAAGDMLPEGSLGYSSTLGRLDYSDPAATAGSLVYGDSAGAGTVRYGLTPDLTLESQVQAAPALTAMGLGGRYAAGGWGTLQAAAVQSRYNDAAGWRYQLGYSVDLGEGATLALGNEMMGPRYSDLSQYGAGYPGVSRMRSTVTAGVPLGGLGTLAGTYAGLRAGSAQAEQRFGLLHTVNLAPRVSLSLGADRDVVSGDYAMQMQLSLPADLFGGGPGWWP